MSAKQPLITRKKPQRSCVACRQTAEKRTLLRFVRDAQGGVAVDASGRAAGRGAYVCADAACFAKACKNRALERALRVTIHAGDQQRLAAEFAEAMTYKMVEE
jgi:predicted RNA-binding protein YlxR (DUF448 family)